MCENNLPRKKEVVKWRCSINVLKYYDNLFPQICEVMKKYSKHILFQFRSYSKDEVEKSKISSGSFFLEIERDFIHLPHDFITSMNFCEVFFITLFNFLAFFRNERKITHANYKTCFTFRVLKLISTINCGILYKAVCGMKKIEVFLLNKLLIGKKVILRN